MNVPKEKLALPTLEAQEWYQKLQAVPLIGLSNKELQVLRMMLQWKPGNKTKLVYKEKDQGEEGWYETSVVNFRVPHPAALSAPLPKGPGMLATLGVHPAAATGGKVGAGGSIGATAAGAVATKAAKAKQPEKSVAIAVKQAPSGAFRPIKTKFEDYVLVSYTLEGLDVLWSSSGVGGAGAGTRPVIGQKRKVQNAHTDAVKKVALRRGRTTLLGALLAPPAKVATSTTFPTPPSAPLKSAWEEKKKDAGPEQVVQVVSSEEAPPVHEAWWLFESPVGETTIYDDVIDSSDNLIDPTMQWVSGEGKGVHKQKSPIFDHGTSSDAGGGVVADQPLIQPKETLLDYYYCMEALKGVGTPAELERLKASGRQNLYLQHALYLIGGAVTGNVILQDWYSLAQKEEEYDWLKPEAATTMEKIQVVEERLAKERTDFEAYKWTEKWAAATSQKQVWSLSLLLSQEHKLWNEACAREYEKFYRLRQEMLT
ncbi:hypothetical protein Hanom_Chr09g00812061 [Helianthus anomalus]